MACRGKWVKAMHVQGIGQEYWADGSNGSSREDQNALTDYRRQGVPLLGRGDDDAVHSSSSNTSRISRVDFGALPWIDSRVRTATAERDSSRSQTILVSTRRGTLSAWRVTSRPSPSLDRWIALAARAWPRRRTGMTLA
jgi:hypothetical protein